MTSYPGSHGGERLSPGNYMAYAYMDSLDLQPSVQIALQLL